jgi:hypothetical protein
VSAPWRCYRLPRRFRVLSSVFRVLYSKETVACPLGKISVTYGLTQSLPDYCNVRPSITLEYVLEPGEDPDDVRAGLIGEARAQVRELVDQALEDAGRPARYSLEQRYAVVISTAPNTHNGWGEVKPAPPERAVCIVPDHLERLVREWGYRGTGVYPYDELRFSHALRLAQKYIATQTDAGVLFRLIECHTRDDLRLIPRAPVAEIDPEPSPIDERHDLVVEAEDEDGDER